ncbi:MAG: hypothetical protein ACAH59_07355, partial [Pseudobdellovibrionaceae bacterium]
MKNLKTVFGFFIGLLAAQWSQAACDQTLNPGANVATAISNAAAGSTICLNAGSYGMADVYRIVKSADVTVQSVSGRTASLAPRINQSNHIKFQNLTLTNLEIDTNQQGGTKNITVLNNTFTGQAVVNVGNNSNANILFEGNTFDGISVCADCFEGRLEVIASPWTSQSSGVTILRNHFGNRGESDGIQIGAAGVVIDGNIFDGIQQGSYGRHVDALQLYGSSHTTIINNYFANGTTYIMAPDGGESEIIKNNVFVGTPEYYWKIQLGSHDNDVFTHNTVINAGVSIDKKVGNSPSTNAIVQNNILIAGGGFKTTDSAGAESCTNCTFSYNLFQSGARGTNNIIGVPTFVGGANPSSWSGYQLASSSLGYKAGNDGQDMGTNYYGSGSVTPPPPPPPVLVAPTNLRVVSLAYNQVKVQWDSSSSSQSGFIVNRKAGSGSYAQAASVSSSTLSYTDAAVAASTQYCYQVKAYDSSSQSA